MRAIVHVHVKYVETCHIRFYGFVMLSDGFLWVDGDRDKICILHVIREALCLALSYRVKS